MNKYVDPQYIINNLCNIFNENLSITLKDVYNIIETAPCIYTKELKNCSCYNCIYSYETKSTTGDITAKGIKCDCLKSQMYGKWVLEYYLCPEWEGE